MQLESPSEMWLVANSCTLAQPAQPDPTQVSHCSGGKNNWACQPDPTQLKLKSAMQTITCVKRSNAPICNANIRLCQEIKRANLQCKHSLKSAMQTFACAEMHSLFKRAKSPRLEANAPM